MALLKRMLDQIGFRLPGCAAGRIRMSPLEFMQRLAWLRAVIVPGPAHKPGGHAEEHDKEHAHPSAHMGWARLLRRVFDLGYISPMQLEKNWLAEQLKSAA